MKVRKVCSECGSESIHVNAWVTWDFEKQEYVIEDFWSEEAWCDDCEDTAVSYTHLTLPTN